MEELSARCAYGGEDMHVFNHLRQENSAIVALLASSIIATEQEGSKRIKHQVASPGILTRRDFDDEQRYLIRASNLVTVFRESVA